MKIFDGKILFFLIITAQGVISEDVERLSDASISKGIGENVTMVWNVTGITASFTNSLTIYISKGKVSSASIVFQFTVNDAASPSKAATGDQSAYKKLASRSTAIYTYTGQLSAGQETARVSFTISNLIMDDEGSYFLTARVLSSPTNISVYYGPEKCGNGLQSEYIVNSSDQLNITSGFCGKPQPNVTCTFGGTPLNNVVIAEVSQHNYTYTVGIPKLEPCGTEKNLTCTIAGYGKSFVDNAVFLRNCENTTPEKKEVSVGVCAGHIVGVEVGVILMCVFIYLYLVVWKATDETGKRVGFIIAVVVGLALVIALSVSYAGLRKSNDNDDLEDCDKAFIAFGAIDIVALIIVVIISVKNFKGNGSKTSHQPDKNRVEKVEVKKTGGATESPEQVSDQNV